MSEGSIGEFGGKIIPYSGLFIAYALGALLMGISEQLAALVFSAALIGSIVGGFTAARGLNHAN